MVSPGRQAINSSRLTSVPVGLSKLVRSMGVLCAACALSPNVAWGAMPHLNSDGLALQLPAAAVVPAEPIKAATEEDVASIRQLGPPTVSDDGAHVAFLVFEPDLALDSYRIAWFVASVRNATAPPVNVGDAGEPSLFDTNVNLDGTRGRGRSLTAKWSSDGRWIAYLRRKDGRDQLWRSSTDGAVREQITFGAAEISEFAWSADNSSIIYSTRWSHDDFQKALASDTRNGVRVTADTTWNFAKSWPIYQLGSGAEDKILAVDFGSRADRPATGAERASFKSSITRSAGMAARWPASTWRAALVAASVHNKQLGELTVEIADRVGSARSITCPERRCRFSRQEAALFHGAKAEMVYFWRREGVNAPGRTLVSWNLRSGKTRDIFRTYDTVEDCTSAGHALVCIYQNPTTAPRLVAIDLRDGRLSTIADPNEAWGRLRLGRTEWLRWSDEQGHPTYGVLAYPLDYKPGRRYPIVLSGYATAESVQGDVGRRYPTHVLASRGFFVLVYHHWRQARGNQTTEEVWKSMYGDDVVETRVPHNQLQAIIHQLDNKGLIDRERVGIGGHSNAMNIAAYGLIRTDMYRAAALGWIRWNPTAYYQIMPSSARRIEAGAGLTLPEEARAGSALEKLSPSLNAACIGAPILVHASDDEFGRSAQMEALVRFADAGRPLEYYVFPDEQHVLNHPAHRLAEFRRNTQWFMYWLQDREASDPIDPGQYARWKGYKDLLASVADKSSRRCPALRPPLAQSP